MRKYYKLIDFPIAVEAKDVTDAIDIMINAINHMAKHLKANNSEAGLFKDPFTFDSVTGTMAPVEKHVDDLTELPKINVSNSKKNTNLN